MALRESVGDRRSASGLESPCGLGVERAGALVHTVYEHPPKEPPDDVPAAKTERKCE